MPDVMRKFALAAAFLWVAAPAWGAGMPDYGTKNFNPSGDTPAFFTNENGAALGVSADSGAEDAAAPVPRVGAGVGPRQPQHAAAHRRGELASRGKPGRSAEAHARGRDHARHEARGGSPHRGAATRGASAARHSGSPRVAHAATAGGKSRSAKAGGAKSGKASLRHAAARPSSHKG